MRILIIDDHALFRGGLRELLQRRGIEVVAAVGAGDEGCRLAAELLPDVVLLDLRMPGMDGLTAIHELRRAGFSAPVVMLTTSHEERDLVERLRSGAQGYLLKDMEPDELVSALHDVVGGRTVVAPDMAGVLARALQKDTPPHPGRHAR